MRAANRNDRADGLGQTPDRGAAEAELHPLAAAIQENWTRLNDRDLAGVRTREDLAARIQARYRLSAAAAAAQVREWAEGRDF